MKKQEEQIESTILTQSRLEVEWVKKMEGTEKKLTKELSASG
jgi:hypothetical protein